LRRAGEVKEAVDALAVALSKAESKNILLELRKGGSGSRPISCYSDDGSYVDLYDLCRRVAGSARLPRQARLAAENVMEAVMRFVIASFGMSGYEQFEAGKNGVFIVLPSGRKHFRWYTPAPGIRPDHGKWSFLKDGATPGNGVVETWFELVDSWFNAPDSGEPKGEFPRGDGRRQKRQGKAARNLVRRLKRIRRQRGARSQGAHPRLQGRR